MLFFQIRSGLAELELKTSQVLQRLENVRTESVVPAETKVAADNDKETNEKANEENAGTTVDKTTAVLQSDRKLPADILKNLESLIAYSDSEDDQEFPLPVSSNSFGFNIETK